jgi:hypothetical protein
LKKCRIITLFFNFPLLLPRLLRFDIERYVLLESPSMLREDTFILGAQQAEKDIIFGIHFPLLI